MTWFWFLLIVVVVFLALWFLYWSDVLFYWADPLNCPASYYNVTYEKKVDEKYLVVGAGFAGLAVCGALNRYNIPYQCVEKQQEIGGNWYSGVYETVHIISSRKTTQYTDYPMPDTYPDFPSAKQMHAYLCDYCDKRDIRQHIRFGVSVVEMQVLNEGTRDEKSVVTFSDGKKETYKGVIIANGHHWDSRIPEYPNQAQFKGQILHSKQYKKAESLVGKRVLIVGGGNSACDIASESARFANEAHISLRRGYWFVPRVMFGKPTVEVIRAWMPVWLQQTLIPLALRIIIGRYEQYGLQYPDHKLFEHHPTINSELLHYLKLGRIKPHCDIAKFSHDNTVEFTDGSQAEFDTVIFCTGYYTSIPLLKQYLTFENQVPNLINGIFVPKLRNVYYFGFGQARYGAGCMYTRGADFLARAIYTQHDLHANIGQVFSGIAGTVKKNPHSADVLLDPHTTWKQTFIGIQILKLLPLLQRVKLL